MSLHPDDQELRYALQERREELEEKEGLRLEGHSKFVLLPLGTMPWPGWRGDPRDHAVQLPLPGADCRLHDDLARLSDETPWPELTGDEDARAYVDRLETETW